MLQMMKLTQGGSISDINHTAGKQRGCVLKWIFVTDSKACQGAPRKLSEASSLDPNYSRPTKPLFQLVVPLQTLPEGKIYLSQHPKLNRASPFLPAVHCLSESRGSGQGGGGRVQRGAKIWKPAGRQKNDKKEQLFVKGNLRRARSSGPKPRLVWSQGRGLPKVRDSGGRQTGVLGPTPGWVPPPLCSDNPCPLPLPGRRSLPLSAALLLSSHGPGGSFLISLFSRRGLL